jgi:hypothetical protein
MCERDFAPLTRKYNALAGNYAADVEAKWREGMETLTPLWRLNFIIVPVALRERSGRNHGFLLAAWAAQLEIK